MSKYIKLEDAIEQVKTEFYGGGYQEWLEISIDNLINRIANLPTIEVSEDCISKHDIWKIIEDNAYWVRYNENSTEKGMTLTGINQALNECPPAIPTVSEDCISRAEMLDTYAELYDVFDDYPNIIEELHKVYDKLNGLSNAISRAEGEWEVEKRDSYFGKKIVLTCSECGDVFSVTESEYPNERYCRYCGAKMKGADNE